jgi:hypothetical protein
MSSVYTVNYVLWICAGLLAKTVKKYCVSSYRKADKEKKTAARKIRAVY